MLADVHFFTYTITDANEQPSVDVKEGSQPRLTNTGCGRGFASLQQGRRHSE